MPDKTSRSADTTVAGRKIVLSENKAITCEQLMADLVKSSNAVAFKYFGDMVVKVRIADVTPEKTTIELYVVNDVSETPSEKRLADNPVGWLEYYGQTGRLMDITNDPDNPLELQYDKTILQGYDLFKLCSPVAAPDPDSFRVEIEKIGKDQSYSAKQGERIRKPVEKITGAAMVQKQLSGIDGFIKEDGYPGIRNINFRNGTPSANNSQLSECSFIAYFPAGDILLSEGGHK